ncbi:hypothetical protein [Mesorhizobium sp. NPDC059025]|uniref:hypothetical protein n=1 Tax=unclassified Mesorhizobium TaxID=325217 RepID=UPI0036A8532B
MNSDTPLKFSKGGLRTIFPHSTSILHQTLHFSGISQAKVGQLSSEVTGNMEDEIANFMLKASKFEFFLVNRANSLALTKEVRGLKVVAGVNWTRLAQLVERDFPFASFNFSKSDFAIFVESVPQYLVLKPEGGLKWDCDNQPVDSWELVLARGYAQLRNNIAHGNKHQISAPFTYDRTAKFMTAGLALMNFIAHKIFSEFDWDTPIFS